MKADKIFEEKGYKKIEETYPNESNIIGSVKYLKIEETPSIKMEDIIWIYVDGIMPPQVCHISKIDGHLLDYGNGQIPMLYWEVVACIAKIKELGWDKR